VAIIDGDTDQVGGQCVISFPLLWFAPDHVAFTVLETDSLGAIGRYLNSIALVQEFNITPVQNVGVGRFPPGRALWRNAPPAAGLLISGLAAFGVYVVGQPALE